MSQKSVKFTFAIMMTLAMVIISSVVFFVSIHNIDNSHNAMVFVNMMNLKEYPMAEDVHDFVDCNTMGCKNIRDQYMQSLTTANLSFFALLMIIIYWGYFLWLKGQ